MRSLYDIKDLIEEELKDISKKDELNETDLDNVFKMVDICKDIATIEAMKEHRYSRDYDDYPMSYGGRSYARYGRDGDGDGRYSERGSSYRDGGYSGHDSTKEKLEQMMRKAGSEQERESIRRVLEQL